LEESGPSAAAEVPASAWGLLAFLTALNVLNFVDRTVITNLAPLLIADLGLSRAEIGLLAGFGFVVFYTTVGLFLGLAADRWPRIPLVASGLALWSAMTAASGFARSFLHLALPRIFVGVGEATLAPSALSMLGDAFGRRRLGMATGVYYAGIPLGSGAGLLLAGWIAPRYGWRVCFFALGIVGVVAAGLLLLFREPARAAAAAAARPSFGALLGDAARGILRRRELALTLLGGSMLVYGAASAMHFVTWLVEERGYDYARAALAAGLVAVPAGFAGNLAGGAIGDRCARRRRNGHLWSLVPMTLFFVPAGVVFYQLPPGTPLFWAGWFVTCAGTSAFFGPLFAAIQELAPPHTRSTTMALALLVVNLLGVGPGPLITGMLGDRYGLTLGLLASLGVVLAAVVPLTLALRAGRDGRM
jgi:MFS family permease